VAAPNYLVSLILLKNNLKLPAKIGYPINFETSATNEKYLDLIDDPSFVLASGLVIWGMNNIIESTRLTFIIIIPSCRN